MPANRGGQFTFGRLLDKITSRDNWPAVFAHTCVLSAQENAEWLIIRHSTLILPLEQLPCQLELTFCLYPLLGAKPNYANYMTFYRQ
jgi:hypothetical protein